MLMSSVYVLMSFDFYVLMSSVYVLMSSANMLISSAYILMSFAHVFDFGRFCVVIRFVQPRHKGFLYQILSITLFSHLNS